MTSLGYFINISSMLDDNISDTDPNISTPQPDPRQTQNQPAIQVPPPPAGDSEKAEKYLGQLISLIEADTLKVIHTDLKKFDIASIQDHYRMDLGEYEVEVNHSKQPDTGQDFYVLLFNNLKKIENAGESCVNKVILAYTHLSQNQFVDFKEAADGALERKRKEEEEKRFADAMAPIDNVLNNMASKSPAEEPKEEFTSEDDDLADFATEPAESNDEPKASDFATQYSSS